MRNLLIFLLLILPAVVLAQKDNDTTPPVNFDLYTGLYQVKFLANRKFNIFKDGDKLMLEIVGQGRTDLIPLGGHRFKANHVKPEAIVAFIPGGNSTIGSLTWTQKSRDQEWTKIAGKDADTVNSKSPLYAYTGKYKPKGNAYMQFTIGIENDHLTGHLEHEDKINLYQESTDYYVLKDGDYSTGYRFIKDSKGDVIKMINDQRGSLECVRIASKPAGLVSSKHNFYTRTHFTHADTLLGMLSPARTCYDVLFYHLDVIVFPSSKSLKGSNLIRFKSVLDFDSLQVDLFANMKISKIVYRNKELAFRREEDAVFVRFPARINKDVTGEIQIYYEGVPQELDLQAAHSGWIWLQDKNEKPWIESVSQGSGSSLWWPCKDHLSDKPDSMELSITVDNGLTAIANGKLISRTTMPNNQTRFDWYVSYPINNYNAAIYIGDYSSYQDVAIYGNHSLEIKYYCLRDNLEKAKSFYSNVSPALNLYQHAFGLYPFNKDGFAIVEAPYPMEHQGAVSMGSIYSPPNSNQFDAAGLLNTLWHEMAHEWWGNNVTCKDYADFWIHESFATYAELLARKNFRGKESYQKVINDTRPENKEPIIGFYGVNDFHMGDVYSKGNLMLTTLQQVVNNDSIWFAMLKGIQERFRYQAITSEDLIGYINQSLNRDYTYFFNQYLRHAAIPVLVLRLSQSVAGLSVAYKWQADDNNFRMPVKVTTSKNIFEFIAPTTEWKSMLLPNMTKKDFKVDRDDFYIGVTMEKD